MRENNMKKYREEKGITLTELSKITNISVGYLCHLEKGSRENPSMLVASKIAEALEKTITDVFSK